MFDTCIHYPPLIFFINSEAESRIISSRSAEAVACSEVGRDTTSASYVVPSFLPTPPLTPRIQREYFRYDIEGDTEWNHPYFATWSPKWVFGTIAFRYIKKKPEQVAQLCIWNLYIYALPSSASLNLTLYINCMFQCGSFRRFRCRFSSMF